MRKIIIKIAIVVVVIIAMIYVYLVMAVNTKIKEEDQFRKIQPDSIKINDSVIYFKRKDSTVH